MFQMTSTTRRVLKPEDIRPGTVALVGTKGGDVYAAIFMPTRPSNTMRRVWLTNPALIEGILRVRGREAYLPAFMPATIDLAEVERVVEVGQTDLSPHGEIYAIYARYLQEQAEQAEPAAAIATDDEPVAGETAFSLYPDLSADSAFPADIGE